MRFKAICLPVVALACAITPLQARAWGDEGHKVIASIAWNYLTPAVQARVQSLLTQDADKLTDSDFASRATWADKYRDSDRPDGPLYLHTRTWHFVDIPVAAADSIADAEAAESSVCAATAPADGQAASAPGDDCVVNKIKQFEGELANPATPVTEQILALKFIIHFVGDVHQPFHAVDHADRGGNCVTLAAGDRGHESLHSYWDTQVVTDMAGPRSLDRFAKSLNDEITPQEKAAWEVDDPALWAAESAVKAREVGYGALNAKALPTCAAPGDVLHVPIAYGRAAQAVAREQLEKAGVRLAFVLNDALK